MINVEVGSPDNYSTDPPFFPFAYEGDGILAGYLPPHNIQMYMKCSSHFLALHNRSAAFEVGMDSDKLQDVNCFGGEFLTGRRDMEFAFRSKTSVEVTVLHYEDSFVERLGVDLTPKRPPQEQSLLRSDPQLDFVMGAMRLALAEGAGEKMYIEQMAAAALLRVNHVKSGELGPSDIRGVKKECERMQRAEEYIRANLSDDISLVDVAGVVGLSVPYFSRCFKLWKGKSPHAFLTEVRMLKARELLKFTNESVAEISLSCGYSSQSHFGQQFRKMYGMTPKHYRLNTQ